MLSVAGMCLPTPGGSSVIAAFRGKEYFIVKQQESLHLTAAETRATDKNRLTGWHKLAAIGALSSVALTGCAAQNVDAKSAPSASTSAEASSASPSETAPSQAEIDAKVTSLEIPAGLDTVALGSAIIDRLNQWANDGSDASLEQRIDNEVPQGKSLEEIAAEIAAENREVYAVALFGENYRAHPSVATYVNQSEGVNRDTVAAYGGTEWNDKATNSEGYRSWRELLTPYAYLLSDEGGARKYVFDYDFHDNADKNLVKEGTLPKGGKLFVTVETVNGVDIVTDVLDQVVNAIN